MFEGLYVPADDYAFGKFLAGESPVNTTAGLSMPFWGVEVGKGQSADVHPDERVQQRDCVAQDPSGLLGLKLTHSFSKLEFEKRFGYRIELGDGSPVTPAKLYRKYLIDTKQFVSMKKKIERTPDAAKLLGATSTSGQGLIGRGDIKDYKKLAAELKKAANAPEDSLAKRVATRMSDEGRKVLDAVPSAEFVDNYQKGVVVDELSRILKTRDLSADGAPGDQPTMSRSRSQLRCVLQGFSGATEPAGHVGRRLSTSMVDALAAAGVERAWLGSPGWDGL